MINWPAIVKHHNDPELTYVDNQAEWNSNEELYHGSFDELDYLVDAAGKVFTLSEKLNHCVAPRPNGTVKTLYEILGLIKAHAANTESCCVSKLYAPSIIDAFKLINSINNDE